MAINHKQHRTNLFYSLLFTEFDILCFRNKYYFSSRK